MSTQKHLPWNQAGQVYPHGRLDRGDPVYMKDQSFTLNLMQPHCSMLEVVLG